LAWAPPTLSTVLDLYSRTSTRSVGAPAVSTRLLRSVRAQVGDQLRKMPGSTGANPYAQMIEDAEGLDKIEVLQVGGAAHAMRSHGGE